MASLESVLADVSYLIAVERSKESTSKTIKKISLPEPSVHSVVHQYLTESGQFTFARVFSQRIGAHYLEKFIQQSCAVLGIFKAIINYENIATLDLRRRKAKEIYDQLVFPNMLAMSIGDLSKAIIDQVSENLRGGRCTPDLFSAMKEHLAALLDTLYMKQFSVSNEYVRYCQWKYMELLESEKISLTDFSVHKMIGKGEYAMVFGSRKDDSGKMFAYKLLDKKRIKMKKGEMLVLNEKNMLAKISSPFVVNLHYAFQTTEVLCFMLDLMRGGDLHYHLTRHGVFSEDEIQFFSAELIVGLEHIHAQGIVHRDLQPSNILLDEVGHIRICDFGLACEYNAYPPSSNIGILGYMAPEVIKKGVHYTCTFTVDWLSLGCVLYKLFTGLSPFRVGYPMYDELITSDQDIIVPNYASKEMVDLLCGLLEKDPSRRLGCKGRGSEELKDLPFFRTVNWEDVLNKKVRPPFHPPRGEVNAADIEMRDLFETSGVKLKEEDQNMYKGFNLVVSDLWQAEMMESIFDTVNAERDKLDAKETVYDPHTSSPDLLLQGYGYMLENIAGIFQYWQRKYFLLYQDRLDWAENFGIRQIAKAHSFPLDASCKVEVKEIKGFSTICVMAGRKDQCSMRFDFSFEQQLWYKRVTDVVTSLFSHSSSKDGRTAIVLAMEKGQNEIIHSWMIGCTYVNHEVISLNTKLLQSAQERVTMSEQKLLETMQQNEAIQQLMTLEAQQAEERATRAEERASRAEQKLLQPIQQNDAVQQQIRRADERAGKAEVRAMRAEQELKLSRQQSEAQLRYRVTQGIPPNSDYVKSSWKIERDEIEVMEGKPLGVGGWGEVRVAMFRGTKVAAKFIHEAIISPHNINLFIREMNMAACVRHPNLLLFIGATLDDSKSVILTELMPDNLQSIIPVLARDHVVSISVDVASGLNYLHLMRPDPIIHRDISSANILVESTDFGGYSAKVSDYGSANFLSKVITKGPGNPSYAAPESSNPKLQSPKMDVYSYGILLLEMATGQFPDQNIQVIQLDTMLWQEMKGMIRRCICEDPANRPAMKDILILLPQLNK